MSKIDDYMNEIIMPLTFKMGMTEDKKRIFDAYCLGMLSRTLGMFEYDGLPETLSARSMEIEMQTNGFCCIAKVDSPAHGKPGLYCFRDASPAGELNAEKLPTKMVCVDTWMNYNEELTIDKDCIVIPNDILWMGLGDLFALHAGQLADAETTMRLQLYNSRANKILTATDDKVIESAKEILKKLKDGSWGVIGDEIELQGMMKALSAIDFTSAHSGSIKDTMEVIQYYLAKWFISLGLNDNFNMKREALNGTETESNANTLFALPLMWLKCREEGIKKLNAMHGTKASVRFGSVWKTAYEKYILSIKVQEKEAKTTDETQTNEPAKEQEEPKEENTNE